MAICITPPPHTYVQDRKDVPALGWIVALRSQDYMKLKCYHHFGVTPDSIPKSFVWDICYKNTDVSMLEYLLKHWKISDKDIQSSCQTRKSYGPKTSLEYVYEFAARDDHSCIILPWLYQRGCDFSVSFALCFTFCLKTIKKRINTLFGVFGFLSNCLKNYKTFFCFFFVFWKQQIWN